MNTAQHLDVLEWVKATRADVIDIMKEDKVNNGYAVTSTSDLDKAEKIIARVLTEVVNRMVDVEPPKPTKPVLKRNGARKHISAVVHKYRGALVNEADVENDIDSLLDKMEYTD